MPTHRILLLALAAVVLFAGCGARGAGRVGDYDGRLITAEEIERIGGRNAWEVLQRSGTVLSLNEDGNGDPARVRQRGNSSISLNNAPLLVVDEARMADLRYLRDIAASTIATIRIINGTRGTARYGTGAGNGVIIVTTRNPGRHPDR